MANGKPYLALVRVEIYDPDQVGVAVRGISEAKPLRSRVIPCGLVAFGPSNVVIQQDDGDIMDLVESALVDDLDGCDDYGADNES